MNTVAVIVLAAVSAVLAAAIWRVSRRIPKHPDHTPRPAIRTAVLDPEPGMNLAWRDECERIWDLPEVQSGLDRLRAAIRDEQNGDHA